MKSKIILCLALVLRSFALMRFAALLFVVALLAGCVTHRDDARLQGTWILNRYASAAATFHQDPLWTNAPPKTVERFRDMTGNMAVTYSHGVETVNRAVSFHYRVVEQGSNYVVIRSAKQIDTNLLFQIFKHDHAALRAVAPIDKGQNIRIRFVNEDTMYWIDTGPLGSGIQERFDKLKPEPVSPGRGGLLVLPPIPLDW